MCVCVWWGCIGYRCFLCFYKRKKILTVSRRFAWIRSAGWPAPSMPFVARYSPTISDSKPTRRKVKSQGSQWSAQAHEKKCVVRGGFAYFSFFPLGSPFFLALFFLPARTLVFVLRPAKWLLVPRAREQTATPKNRTKNQSFCRDEAVVSHK